ncbi:class I SAM-dependent methyltransferase [Phenylobacterium sp.]|uniref:class I SAM-dependent methyltransferase n=1 Tax=Phenylobacterium sp. TaxID=1871053 RepID=UPI0025EF414F|nr:class I SAM-dependent methyltransferase [Phenylobacterium sp.]
MPGKSFITNKYHWAVKDQPKFWESVQGLREALKSDAGVFSSDAMIVWARNLGFLDDEAFVQAWDRHAEAPHERGILWRSAVLVWAARQAVRRDGDFVECGCYAGTSMKIVLDTVDLSSRQVFLYDLFEHSPDMAHHAMPDHGPDLYDRVRTRFASTPNVSVIKGFVPESFALGVPDKISFAHIDMNNAAAEIAALDALEPRLTPGAVIVLDDYGQLPYQAQHLEERAWFARRGVPILEIPTGQAVVIW